MTKNVAKRVAWGLVLIGVIYVSSCSGQSSIYSGFLGCRFSQSVCRQDEECVDDLLFGTCQKVGAEQDNFVWDQLSTSQLNYLETEVRRLISQGYAWQDLYTQCVLGNILLAYRAGRPIDSSFCDSGGGADGLTEQLSQDALLLLQQYFEDYYTGGDEGRGSESEEGYYGGPEDVVDLEVPSREYALPLYSDEDSQGYEEKKADELVNIHKYQKSRKRMDSAPDSSEDWDRAQGEDNRQLWPSDAQLLAALQQQLQQQNLDNNYDLSDVAEGQNNMDYQPSYDDLVPQLEGEGINPDDAKVLGDLLTGDISVSSLNDDEIERVTQYVDTMLAMMDNTGQARTRTEEDHAVEGGDTEAIDNIQDMPPPAVIEDVIGPEEKRVEEPHDPHDHGLAKAGPVPTAKPKYGVVDTNYVDLSLNPRLTQNDMTPVMAELTDLFGVLPGDFTDASVHDGKLNFRVDVLNATFVGSMAKEYSERLKNATGYAVVKASLGSNSRDESQVDISEATTNGPKYFVLTFVLCGVIAGVVLAVIAIYMVRRHSQFRSKLEGMSTMATDAPAASNDYQDLCRQRMQSKASEKPEPLHVASRVGSVSATEQAARSPSSRSSTSSWSEEPVTSNMDISTGHIVLSYMEDHLKNRERLAQEWQGLCAYEAEPNAATVATLPANTRKNRYTDILPYDHSRVVLSSATNVSGSDYINASTITDHDPRNPAYIATQGPLPHTVADFWQMIWEQGSVVIVNLTRLTEEGVAMCHRYWPEEGSDLYHIYEVHLVSEHIWCEDYLVRSFYLKNLQTNETRTVTQFHFLTWQDLGVPASAKALLDFRRKVNKSYRGRSCPVIVQCSDGVGRSGTYTLIDMVLNRMSKGAKEIDIAATLEHIRDQRMNMVKTKEQFEFALAAVAEEVHAILKALPQ